MHQTTERASKGGKEHLHCHCFSDEFVTWMCSNQETQPLGTVEDNVIRHAKQQKEKAKEARKSHHTIGAPTIRNFKHIIKSDQMRNCPVTLEDIDEAEKIHGKDILHIKGKTTRQNPTSTTIMNIAMPKKPRKEQEHHIMH